jgi:hypothetical protein
MDIILPAVFDNRHEKNKWTLIPIIFISIILIFAFLPMIMIVQRNAIELLIFFCVAFAFCMILGLWYHFTIPSYVILDPNLILFDRFFKIEMYPFVIIKGISRSSNGILVMKMLDGRNLVKVGIDNMIIYHLKEYYEAINPIGLSKKNVLPLFV